jgi:hypothetical protein
MLVPVHCHGELTPSPSDAEQAAILELGLSGRGSGIAQLSWIEGRHLDPNDVIDCDGSSSDAAVERLVEFGDARRKASVLLVGLAESCATLGVVNLLLASPLVPDLRMLSLPCLNFEFAGDLALHPIRPLGLTPSRLSIASDVRPQRRTTPHNASSEAGFTTSADPLAALHPPTG